MSTLVLHQHVVSGGGPHGSPPGIPVLTSAVLYVLVVLAGLLAAPYLTGVRVTARSLRLLTGLLGAAYGVLLLALIIRGETFTLVDLKDGAEHTFLIAVHLVAAAIWAGGVIHLAFVSGTVGRDALGAALRRFSRYAIGSAIALPATGVGLVLIHHIEAAQLTGTTWGRLVLVKSALLGTSVLLALGHRRARRGGTRLAFLRTESLALATVLGVAVVLTGLPDPAAAVTSSAPGLVTVSLGDAAVPLYLHRTSVTRAQLIYGGEDAGKVTVIDRAIGRSWHPARGGATTWVTLQRGTARLTVTEAGKSRNVTLAPETGHGSAWFALGADLAAGEAPQTGSANCLPSSFDLGAGYARSLSAFGVDAVAAVGDGTARSRSFTRGLTHAFPGTVIEESPAAAAHGRRTVVITSWARTARATLDAFAGHVAANRGVYLAPWLLNGDVLSRSTSVRLPLVSVGAYVDPMSPTADRYRATLARSMPGLVPDIESLRGYLAVADPEAAQPSRLVFYAAAPVGFLPGILDVGHQHSSDGWFHDGTLTAMNRGLTVRTTCSNP